MRSSLARAAGAVAVTAVTAACTFSLAAVPASFTDATDTSLTTAAAASFGLTPPAGATGCVSEDGSAGSCQNGTALTGAGAVAVSPDGASVYATAVDSNALSAFSRVSGTGVLTQLAGTAGCLSHSGTGGACTLVARMFGTADVAVSPDGAHVYVVAYDSNALNGFSRNAGTSALTVLSACGGAGVCWGTTQMLGPTSVAVSPDGANVYVASMDLDAVFVLARDQATGVLTALAGTSACVSRTGADGMALGVCDVGTGLNGASGVTVSPDGKNVYVTGESADSVAVFARDPATGALTQLAGTAGCVSETGDSGVCADGRALDAPMDVTVSPDGASVYVATRGSDAVVVLGRNAATGALTQLAGTAGCVSETGSGGDCADGVGFDGARSVVVSPDGRDVYVAADVSDAVPVLWRNTGTGALQQAGTTWACVSRTGTGGSCVSGPGLDGAAGLAVTPDGADVYVAARTSHAVTLLTRLP